MASVWTVHGLEADMPIRSALALILRKRFAEMWAFAEAAAFDRDMEAVHDMRVAARRVQGVMRLFRNEFPPVEFRKHERIITNLIKTLGRVRDYDVSILAVRKFRKRLSAEDGKALSVLLIRDNTTRRDRAKVLAREVKTLRATRYDKAALRFFDSSAPSAKPRNGRPRSLRERTRALVPTMFRALAAHAEHVIADAGAIEELHEMRLAGKPLRYLMEVSAQVFGEQFGDCLAEIKEFLDVAGTIHDSDVRIIMLEDFLKSWDGPAPRQTAAWQATSRAGIVKFIRHEKALRRRKFAALTKMVKRWRDEGFERTLLKSVALPAATHIQALKHARGTSNLFLAES